MTLRSILASGSSVFVVLALLTLVLGKAIYNAFFHRLNKFPGPFFCRFSDIPYCIWSLSGRQPYRILNLHETYGPVVRIAPNELSFSSSESWKDIYGTSSTSGLPKSDFYDKFVTGLTSVVSERDAAKHREMRHQTAPAFSDRALKDQEPLIANVIDCFIDKLGELGEESADLVKWFNLVTFEIMGELAFGVTFGGLDDGLTHPWVANVQKAMEAGFVIDVLGKSIVIGIVLILRHFLWLYRLARGTIENKRYTSQYVDERLQRGSSRNDFISAILKESKNSHRVMSSDQMKAHATDVIFAGSETTATTLAACIWYIKHDPKLAAALQHEVRNAFSSYEEINNSTASQLKLVNAACSETLRVYPPLPFGLPRICPEDILISGHIVPRGTIVSTHAFAASMSGSNFASPWKFRLDRWLDEATSDDLAASRPFSMGSRMCLGRSLGWLEMRTILSKLLYRYDIELLDGTTKDWHADSEMFLFWKKPSLLARLTRVQP